MYYFRSLVPLNTWLWHAIRCYFGICASKHLCHHHHHHHHYHCHHHHHHHRQNCCHRPISPDININLTRYLPIKRSHPISATFFPFLPFLSMPRIVDHPAPRSPISLVNDPSPNRTEGSFNHYRLLPATVCFADLMFDQMINGKGNLLPDHFHFLSDDHLLFGKLSRLIKCTRSFNLYYTQDTVQCKDMMALFIRLNLSLKWIHRISLPQSLLQLFSFDAVLSPCPN